MPSLPRDPQWSSQALGLSDSAFAILRDLVHERTGLFYENGKRDMLAYRLSGRVLELGLSSFLDYYYLLRYDPAAEEEWQRLMDALSVQETYFWREAEQVRALVDIIVPQYAANMPGKPLRIWSAGCATGEEPLTIALALEEAGWFERLPIVIGASDASPAAIAQARNGVYRERSFRNLPAELREKYFAPVQGGWRVLPCVHERVTWRVANLLDEAQVARLAAPVVFCRNVFIYFSDQAVRRVLSWLHRYMPAGGYLFTSAAESLLRVTADFALQELDGAFAYIRLPGQPGPDEAR